MCRLRRSVHSGHHNIYDNRVNRCFSVYSATSSKLTVLSLPKEHSSGLARAWRQPPLCWRCIYLGIEASAIADTWNVPFFTLLVPITQAEFPQYVPTRGCQGHTFEWRHCASATFLRGLYTASCSRRVVLVDSGMPKTIFKILCIRVFISPFRLQSNCGRQPHKLCG